MTQRLGAAEFVRNDGPAEIWQYRDSGCVLDLYLYPDNTGAAADPRVTHVDTRGRDGVGAADADCVNALLRTRSMRAAAGGN